MDHGPARPDRVPPGLIPPGLISLAGCPAC